MFKKLFVFVLALTLCAGALALPLFAASDDILLSKAYFYDQLSNDARLIYDVLVSDEQIEAIQHGQDVVIDSFSINIPQNVNQAQFDSLVDRLTEEKERMSDMMPYTADAVAALDRDRSDIFWTNGLHARVNYLINGEVQMGGISISPGNYYTVQFTVSLPVVEDWDGDGQYDRDLLADRKKLQDAVKAVAKQAKEQGSTRYDQLQYVNDLLCRINEYHTDAANDADFALFYPWTALSALYPLDTENDTAEDSLMPVCEGYARAVKMICDELEIPCILVSGIGNGENHMWNYVQMEDGLWYALDVTWNDTASTNRYFLKGEITFRPNHTTTGIFIPDSQTIAFTYPALSAKDYVVPTTAVDIVLSKAPELTEGYEAAEPITVTLLNYGTRSATLKSITLDDDTAMVLDGTLPADALAAGEADASIRLLINENLAAGVYEATITLVYGNGWTDTETVTLTVKEKPHEPEWDDPKVSDPDTSEPSTSDPNTPSDAVTDPTQSEKNDVEASEKKPSASKPTKTTDSQESDPTAITIGCRGQGPSCLLLLMLLIPVSFVLRKKQNG